MDPKIVVPPVPVPPSKNDFKKSKVILVLAYIQLIFIIVIFISMLIKERFYFFSVSNLISVIPSILVITTKNKTTYTIVKILLILEYILPILAFIALFIFLSNMPSWL